ncbi:MAG: hypothetical protein Q7O12_16275 [Deltaproteobacteria bacterium]|nr:hypothetical protein [Deltaproteobacteria bacterium]
MDVISWLFPYLLPIITSGCSLFIGYKLALRKFRKENRRDFILQQVKQFYSPMVGSIKHIRANRELRLELSNVSDVAWHKICEENPKPFHSHKEHFEPFMKQIEYDNQQFRDRILPIYEKMVDIFTNNLWLAEESTKIFYNPFRRYVELWQRYLDDAIPQRVIEELCIEEKYLLPFYEDLEKKLQILRNELAQ